MSFGQAEAEFSRAGVLWRQAQALWHEAKILLLEAQSQVKLTEIFAAEARSNSDGAAEIKQFIDGYE